MAAAVGNALAEADALHVLRDATMAAALKSNFEACNVVLGAVCIFDCCL